MEAVSLHALVEPAIGQLIAQVLERRPNSRLFPQPDTAALIGGLTQQPGPVVLQATLLGDRVLSAVEDIRNLFPGGKVPILMLIEGGESVLRDACLASGVNDVAVLPIDGQGLADALSRAAGMVIRRSERIVAALPAELGGVQGQTTDICMEAVKIDGPGLPGKERGLYQVTIGFPTGPLTLWAKTVRTEANSVVAGFTALIPSELEALRSAIGSLGTGVAPASGSPADRTPTIAPQCEAFVTAAANAETLPEPARAALGAAEREALAGEDAGLRTLVGVKLLLATVDVLLRARPTQTELDWSVAAARDAGAALSTIGNRIGALMLKPGDGAELNRLRTAYGPLQRGYMNLRLLVDKAIGLGPMQAESDQPARTANQILANAEQKRDAQNAPSPTKAPMATMRAPMAEQHKPSVVKWVLASLVLAASLGAAGWTYTKPKPLHLQMKSFPEMSFVDFERAKVTGTRFTAPATDFLNRLKPEERQETLHRIAGELCGRGYTEGALTLPDGKSFTWPGAGIPTAPLPPRAKTGRR
jgi:hypothetical protein